MSFLKGIFVVSMGFGFGFQSQAADVGMDAPLDPTKRCVTEIQNVRENVLLDDTVADASGAEETTAGTAREGAPQPQPVVPNP